MRLLITGGDGRLARAAMTALTGAWEIRALDDHFTAPLPPEVEIREGDLRQPEFAAEAVQGVDAVLHLAPLEYHAASDTDAVDLATRGTYHLTTAAVDVGVERFVLGSSLGVFDRLPANWMVDESWRPRPTPEPDQLCPWLAELSVREITRTSRLHVLCLRFGRIVETAEAASQPFDPRWLHLEDAVAGIRCALAENADRRRGVWAYHLTAPGERAKIRLGRARRDDFGYKPAHDFHERWESAAPETSPPVQIRDDDWREALAPSTPIPSRPIRNVVIFGAGGPVGAVLARELAPHYTLQLTDVRPLAEIFAEGKLQFPGAPLAQPLPAPHIDAVVDIRDGAAVLAACEGMDVIINCSVVRNDPADAFRVNTLGAYHVARAAAAHGIRRLVHTGPTMTGFPDRNAYAWDEVLPGDAPARPDRDLYFHSKFLGQEICRTFAEYYGLEVPVLLFCQFLNPQVQKGRVHAFAITWEDSARAIRAALEAPSLPSPYEVFTCGSDQPHARFLHDKARLLLGWTAQDSLAPFWVY